MAIGTQIRSVPARAVNPAAADAAAVTVMHVESALQSLTLADWCLECGANARPPVRAAIIRIRQLCTTLALQADEAMAVSLNDLCDYMCRQVRAAAEGVPGTAKLADICELLREIRCAWVTGPHAAPTLYGGAARATHLM
jgi:flagellin-specific chaperone FliS